MGIEVCPFNYYKHDLLTDSISSDQTSDDSAEDCSQVATFSRKTHLCVCQFARVVQPSVHLSVSLVAGCIWGKTNADKAEVLVHSLGSEDFVYTLRTYPIN